jgi:hypothetical protein
MQVSGMLKNGNHNQNLDDQNGHRIEGRVPATNTTGTRNISAHVKSSGFVLVINN